MFRYRQSSLGGPGFPNVSAYTVTERSRLPLATFCMHGADNRSAFRTPSHFWTGIGGRHRKSPIGGAANGMPLKAVTPPEPLIPEMRPPSTRTSSSAAAAGPPTPDHAENDGQRREDSEATNWHTHDPNTLKILRPNVGAEPLSRSTRLAQNQRWSSSWLRSNTAVRGSSPFS